jgi:hypothetical protein
MTTWKTFLKSHWDVLAAMNCLRTALAGRYTDTVR